MESPHDPTLEALRSKIAADLEPVRPWHPVRWLLPLETALVLALLVWQISRRGWHSEHAGSPWMWLPSCLELGVALVLLVLALRQSSPGQVPGWGLVALGVGSAVVFHALIAVVSWLGKPLEVPASKALVLGPHCFGATSQLALPSLLLVGGLAAGGLFVRPRGAGILAGLGAGLAGDAIWRMFCPYTELAHVFSSHTLAVGAAMALGWLLAALWELGRVWWWRRRRDRV